MCCVFTVLVLVVIMYINKFQIDKARYLQVCYVCVRWSCIMVCNIVILFNFILIPRPVHVVTDYY